MNEAETKARDRSLAPPIGPWRRMFRKLLKNRVACTGGVILLLLYGGACLAGFFAPYHYDTSNSNASFVGPMLFGGFVLESREVASEIEAGEQVTVWDRRWRWFEGGVHFHDGDGNFTLRPHVHPLVEKVFDDQYDEHVGSGIAADTTRSLPIVFFPKQEESREVASLLGLFPIEGSRRLAGVDLSQANLNDDETAGLYLLGTDRRGRDIFSRLLFGGQISLSVGLLGILISMSLAMLLGAIAGYFGGIMDFLLMRGVEVVMAVPGLYLILTLRYMLPADLPSRQTYLLIVVILAFVGWAANSRVIRGMVLSIRENDYVTASRALGQRSIWIILRHILPNAFSYVIVTSTLYIPYYIIGEVSLSFLGLGIRDPEASWGLMLRDAQAPSDLKSSPWLVMPGIAVFIAVLAFNFLGDGLRDAADPRAVVSRDGVGEKPEDEDDEG